MTSTSVSPSSVRSHVTVTGRRSGAWSDLWAVALRAIRLALREPEAILPAIFIPMFFFIVNVGSLQKFVDVNAQ